MHGGCCDLSLAWVDIANIEPKSTLASGPSSMCEKPPET